MRTLALRRCAPVLRSKPRHGHVLRLRGRVGQRRTGSTDRDGSDPPLSMPGTASGRVGCARPSTLRREVAPVQQSRAGRPSVTWDGRVPDLAAWAVARAIGGTPALLGDARLPDGRPVGERVIRRLEAALKPPSRVGIDGSGATPRDGGQGCENTPASEPVAGPRTGGSLPSPPQRPVWPRPAEPRKRKTLLPRRIRGGSRVNPALGKL